ncbi:MAG: hypothetical protein NPIRA06_09800 [Nitrospirales bacterium]|nr:MAG: hypothetical protein NPIRA06_09800 [Nitrospirales bacterium]
MQDHSLVHQIKKPVFTSIVIFGFLNQGDSLVRVARFETVIDFPIMGKCSAASREEKNKTEQTTAPPPTVRLMEPTRERKSGEEIKTVKKG